MTRDEILEIESCNEKQLAGINQTLDRISQFFVYSLILRICLARGDMADLRQVCDIFSDNSFSLKEDNNELYKYFKEVDTRLAPALEDPSSIVLPSKEKLVTWAKFQAAAKFLETPILEAQELLKEEFPQLRHPYRGMVLKLNLAATEANRASKFILDLIKKLVEHDLKVVNEGSPHGFREKPVEINFKKLNAEVSLKLPSFIHKLYKETIADMGKTWPKALLRKVFLNVYRKEEDLDFDEEIPDEDVRLLDAFTQIPKPNDRNTELFIDPLTDLYVIGILVANFSEGERTAEEFHDFCNNYLPEAKPINPENNQLGIYLESAQQQISTKLKNSNDFVVPTSSVIGFWTHTQTFMQLFREGICQSMETIEKSPHLSDESCRKIMAALSTGIVETSRVVDSIDYCVSAMRLHNDDIEKIPSRKKAISLDYMESIEAVSEKMAPMLSLYLQELALSALDKLQETCPTTFAEDIDDDSFLVHTELFDEKPELE